MTSVHLIIVIGFGGNKSVDDGIYEILLENMNSNAEIWILDQWRPYNKIVTSDSFKIFIYSSRSPQCVEDKDIENSTVNSSIK